MPLHYRAVILSFDVDDPADADYLAELVCKQIRPQMNRYGCEGESATAVPAVGGQLSVPVDPEPDDSEPDTSGDPWAVPTSEVEHHANR